MTLITPPSRPPTSGRGAHVAARRRAGRHRLLRRARHVGGGGLDARQGRRARTPTPPTSASTTSPTSTACPTGPSSTAPRPARLVDCRDRARARGPDRPAVRRVPHHAPPARRTSTPRRSAGPSPARCWCGRCTTTASTSGATAAPTRATTSSASTATGCWSTRTCGSTSRGSTSDVRRRARRPRTEMSEFLVARGLPYRDADGEGVLHRRQHLGRDARGQVARGAGARAWTSSTRSWAWRTGTRAVAIASRGRHGALRGGLAGGDQRRASSPRQVDLVIGGQRHRRPPRPRHERPDREPHHRGQEPRHLRGARRWRCCTSPTSGW